MFTGVAPPPAVVRALTAAVDGVRDDPGAPRWSDPADLHITLAFLGEVPGARVAGLLGALGPVAAGAPPATLQLTGAGTFGRRPRVLWAGVGGDVDVLGALAGRVAAAARHAGVPVEDRPFLPHLTLGRWPGSGTAATPLPDRLPGPHGPPWRPAALVLWRSRPGTRYERLAGWPLGGSGPVAR
ncbi:RNA 2',3'-cyclic phosphodiesterase [Klenkia taihuensis]|uniref:RNA 2',3'-cyclic phosphodiesterase n=1 Tax=Klenkia taihuensis TaxID=1225127 RepID=UPI00227D8E37|nr:RNA 2',3'-cyclic phosphodiesterase [Klenkia taihuensis]